MAIKRVKTGSTGDVKKPDKEAPAEAKEEAKSPPPSMKPTTGIRVKKKGATPAAKKTDKPAVEKEEKKPEVETPPKVKTKKPKRISSRRDKPLEIEEPAEQEAPPEEEFSESEPEEEKPKAPKKAKPKKTTAKGSRQKKGEPEKKSGPNIWLIGIVLFLIVIALWFSKSKTTGQPERTSRGTIQNRDEVDLGSIGSSEKIFEKSLADRGKAVGIGNSALEFKAEGLDVLGVDSVPGLKDLLKGTDVEAVANALSKAGIKHVLVDPSWTRTNPIPTNSVENRLALAKPAGSLSAKLMSRKLFHYELGSPPISLSTETKKALLAIVRDTFGGGSGKAPAGSPAEINKKGKWSVILTVRPMQSGHISYHSLTLSSLADAAAEAGRKARKYYNKRASFQERYGPLQKVLDSKITLEFEIAYDFGTFVGPKDKYFMWRIIEPGIHGIRMKSGRKTQYQPPWYSVTGNWRLVGALLDKISKKLGHDKDHWMKAEVPFERFRTLHWRERTPGGEIEDLYRASAKVPTMKDVTRENMIASLKGLGDWIADNQTSADGAYVYRYFPVKDEESNEYNFVRHCLGPFSMALTEEFAPHPKYQEKAEAGMKFIESTIRWGGPPRNVDGSLDDTAETWMGKPLPGPDVAIMDFQEPHNREWSAKMGAVAVTILGYTQYKRVGWKLSAEHEKVLQGLANFLLYMQNEEEGNFHHYYVGTRNHYYGTRNSIYPGEILYAVARLYGETKDDRYKVAFKKSFEANLEWFKGQMAQRLPDGTYEEEHRKNLVQFQPWMAMALDEMYRYDPDPAYVEASNLVSLWILDTFQFDETRAFFPDYLGGYMKVLDELPAMHTFVYTEGTAASFDLARRAGSDPKTIARLRKGAMESARFIMQMQARPGENDYYYKNPNKAKGGVRYCMNHNKQRIDYTYHALSSVYRILKAATEEDYAAVQSIPMPKAW